MDDNLTHLRPFERPRLEIRMRYGWHGGVQTEWEVSVEGVPLEWAALVQKRFGRFLSQVLLFPERESRGPAVALAFIVDCPHIVVLAALQILTRGDMPLMDDDDDLEAQ